MEKMVHLIKKNGQRLTVQKKLVLTALKQKPQSVLEILKAVSANENSIDKATVYRILTGLKKIGIVREIHLTDREACFELANCGHHHHLVCEKCGYIEDISLCEDMLIKAVEKQTLFEVTRHSLEFFGTCKKCQH